MIVKDRSYGSSGITPAQQREAEWGLRLVLRRQFPPAWIARHAGDLIGQAHLEYAEWLEDHPPARNPVGWLISCAFRRAKNLADADARRPAATSIEAACQLVDRSTPTPEQEVIEGEGRARLQSALARLPDKECKLLALVYFRDHSVREAGRRLGWRKSAADRHHRRALEKLRALVGEDRTLLTPAHLGLGAWAVSYGDGRLPRRALEAALAPGRRALALGAEAGEWASRNLAEFARRATLLGDQAGIAASGGGGRFVGACGVAVASVVCGIAAGGGAPVAATPGLAQAIPVIGPPGSTLALQAASVSKLVVRTPAEKEHGSASRGATFDHPDSPALSPVAESTEASPEPGTPESGGAEWGGIAASPAPETVPPPPPPPVETEVPPPVGGTVAGAPARPEVPTNGP